MNRKTHKFYQKIIKEEWIKQWEANIPLFWVDIWMMNYSNPIHRKNIFGCDGNSYMVISKDKKGLESYVSEKDFKKFRKRGLDFYLNFGEVKKHVRDAKVYFQKYLNYTKELYLISKNQLQKIPTDEFVLMMKKLVQMHSDFVAYTKIGLTGYSDRASLLLLDLLSKKKCRDETQKVFNLLTTPISLTFLDEERLDLLEIAIKFYNRELKNKEILRRSLVAHKNKFGWIGAAEKESLKGWNLSYFTQELNKLWKRDKKELEDEYRKIKNKPKNLRRQIARVIKKYNLSTKVLKLAEGLRMVAESQFELQRFGFTITMIYVNKFLKEAQRRVGISEKEFFHITATEMIEYLEKNKKIDKRKFNIRFPLYIYVFFYGNKRLITGDEAKKVITEIEEKIKLKEKREIKGLPVFRGVKKGKVKILSQSLHKINLEFKKVKPGDIVVVSMTRPHLLPILKKAGAIITNEGGITCHAAIMSRELKIPTIVGTHIATKVLKDGDLVEVDAEKGVVKVIKRAK